MFSFKEIINIVVNVNYILLAISVLLLLLLIFETKKIMGIAEFTNLRAESEKKGNISLASLMNFI